MPVLSDQNQGINREAERPGPFGKMVLGALWYAPRAASR